MSAIDADIEQLEQLTTHLQASLSSLAEAVLQNRRGLGLPFLQGGLCVALEEECCFYVDHSGVVKESMNLIRKRLQERKLEHEQSESWYESIYNWFPGLVASISALAGPLLVLSLLLTLGPCITNRLTVFVRERINTAQLMALRSQYQPLDPISRDPPSCSDP